MSSLIPISLIACSVRTAAAASVITALSVTSRCSRSAGMPVCSRMPRIISGRPRSISWFRDRFTLMLGGAASPGSGATG